MKKCFFIIGLFLMFGGLAQAQEKSRERDRDDDKSMVQKRDRIHMEEHMVFQDGKLYQVRQGERTQVQTQLKLKNGMMINPDGSYQLMNKERYQLKNGECLDMAGNRYQNQNMFNKRQMMKRTEMERNRNMNRMPAKGTKKMPPKGNKMPAGKNY